MRRWFILFGRALATLVCETLMQAVCIPLPTKRLRDDYGCVCGMWCYHVHNPLEMALFHDDGYATH